MTERERMTKLIDNTLSALEDPPDGVTPEGAVAMVNALESLVTARALLGEDPASLTDVVDAAAARFDARPLHRASIEARAELAGEGDQMTAVDAELDLRSVTWLRDENGRQRDEILALNREIRAARKMPADADQLTTLRRVIDERDARIRELEYRIEQRERESNELTVRLQLARSEPRFPGLTQEQAKLLKRTVHNTLTGEVCDGAIAAIAANTAGAR